MKIIKSPRKINPMGGINFVILELKKMRVPGFIDKYFGERVKQAKYSYSDIILGWVMVNFCGGERLEDAESFKNDYESIPGKALPSPDSFARAFKGLTTKTTTLIGNLKLGVKHEINVNMPLNNLLIDMAVHLGVVNTKTKYTLDYDHTIISTCKKDANPTYTGIKKRGYQPGVAFLGKIPVYIEGRNGNSNARFNMAFSLENTLELLRRRKVKVKKFRSDSAAFQQSVIDLLEYRGIEFYIRIADRKGYYRQISNWQPIVLDDERVEMGSTVIEFRGQTYRAVFIRLKNKLGEYKHFGIVTNNSWISDYDVIKFYNGRGAIERNFDDLKNNWNWGRIPFSNMNENQVFLIVSALSCTMYHYILKKLSGKVEWVKRSWRLKNFIFNFLKVSSEWDGGTLIIYNSNRDYGLILEDP